MIGLRPMHGTGRCATSEGVFAPVLSHDLVAANERSFAAAAVKSPDDGRAQRPFTTTNFHAAMALASSMFTQNDRGWPLRRP